MEYLDRTSLANTIDNVSEALLFGVEIDIKEKAAIASFIVNRHYATGAYANMFAPTEFDAQHDLVLFTGEKVKTRAGRYHMMGEEASRVLRKLGIDTPEVRQALQEADSGILSRINKGFDDPRYQHGTYCCKNCSCALWLNLAAGGLNNNIDMLIAGLNYLKQHREEKGTWKSFHYYYTLYVLNEIGAELAMGEMQFVSRSIERWIKRKPEAEDKYSLRRFFIGESILKKIN